MKILNFFLLFFFLFSINSYSLPECDSNNEIRNNCIGTFTLNDTEYVGEWKNGFMRGKGTFTYSDGSKYVGEFRGNKEEKSTMTYADGKEYNNSDNDYFTIHLLIFFL